MGFCLIPDYSFSEITDISQDFLSKLKIKLLMIDLDNTLAAYDEHSPSDDILDWISKTKDIGITVKLVSNSTRFTRVGKFAELFDVQAVAKARKPSPVSLLKCMETSHIKPEESALIGDQIFTDVLAANRAEAISIIIKPRKFTNIFLSLRYLLELPIRFFARNKIKGNIDGQY